MKASAFLLLYLVVLPGCLIIPEKARPEVTLEGRYLSQYNHRGMVQNNRGVVQGDLDVLLPTRFDGNLSLHTFGNMDLRNRTGDAWFPDGKAGKMTEFQVQGAYAQRFAEYFTVDVGLHNYSPTFGNEFPNGVRGPTTEIFGVLGADVWVLHPHFDVHYDYDEAEGFYLSLGIAAAPEIPIENVRVEGDVSLSYSDKDSSFWTYGDFIDGFSDLRGILNVFYDVDAMSSLTAGVGYSTIVDSELRDWFDLIGIEQDNYWFQLGVIFRFF